MLWQCLACCMVSLGLRKCFGSTEMHGMWLVPVVPPGADQYAKQLASHSGWTFRCMVLVLVRVHVHKCSGPPSVTNLILYLLLLLLLFCLFGVWNTYELAWLSVKKSLLLSEQLCMWLLPETICSFLLRLNVMPRETTWATTSLWPFQSTSLKD